MIILKEWMIFAGLQPIHGIPGASDGTFNFKANECA
jgi:hypothetical protein